MSEALLLGGPVNFGPTAAGVQLLGGGFLLLGWAVENTDMVNPGRLVLRDGANVAGQYLIPITLGAGESRSDDAPGRRVLFESGLFVDVTLGSMAGTLWVAPTMEVMQGGQLVRMVEDRFGGFHPIGGGAAMTAADYPGGVTP